jgi:hypothetical protein
MPDQLKCPEPPNSTPTADMERPDAPTDWERLTDDQKDAVDASWAASFDLREFSDTARNRLERMPEWMRLNWMLEKMIYDQDRFRDREAFRLAQAGAGLKPPRAPSESANAGE